MDGKLTKTILYRIWKVAHTRFAIILNACVTDTGLENVPLPRKFTCRVVWDYSPFAPRGHKGCRVDVARSFEVSVRLSREVGIREPAQT